MPTNSTPSDLMSDLLQATLVKQPELAQKQLRLLQKISADSSSKPPAGSNDSASSATPAPSNKEQ